MNETASINSGNMDFSILPTYGIDVAAGLTRCMRDRALYASLLRMFESDETLVRAEAALAAGSRSEFFACMHELKGLSGNAAMTALYEVTASLVERLRADVNALSDEELRFAFAPVQEAYASALEGIRLADRNTAD